MALALIGTVIISLGTMVGVVNGRLLLNTTDLTTGQRPLLGNTLALIGGLAGAVYFLIGRKLRPSLSLTSYATLVYGTAAICLVVMVWLTGSSMVGYSSAGLFAIFGVGDCAAVDRSFVF